MDCGEFRKVVGEYVNRTLDDARAKAASAHVDNCPGCAHEASKLVEVSMLVRSLDRASTPAGFEDRLRARLAAQKARSPQGVWSRFHAALRSAWEALAGMPSHRLAFRPALAAFALCVIIAAGSVFMFAPTRNSNTASDVDWAYIETCKDQHASFAGSNPLGDESAVALRERAGDTSEDAL